MKSKSYAPAIALLLAACGGGGDDSPGIAVNPPAQSPSPGTTAPPASTPAPAAPAPGTPAVVIGVPTSVTAPLDPSAATPPEGTYVLGRVVKDAMLNSQYQNLIADEIDPTTGQPRADGTRVEVNFYTGAGTFENYSRPLGADTGTPKFPFAGVIFPVLTSNEGFFTLGQDINGYSYVNNQGSIVATPLVRSEGPFSIRDDAKFLIDATAAEWRGANGAFLQLQIGTYSLSNTVFLLCLHESFADVRRRTCGLYNKDTGQKRGAEVIDDSRNIGQILYRPTTIDQPAPAPTAPPASPPPVTAPPAANPPAANPPAANLPAANPPAANPPAANPPAANPPAANPPAANPPAANPPAADPPVANPPAADPPPAAPPGETTTPSPGVTTPTGNPVPPAAAPTAPL